MFPLPIMWHLVLHYSLRTVTSMKGWCPMNHSYAFSHLTLEERRIILTGISNGSTKSAIAKTIGKDRSTVAKEIRLHRTLSHKCKMPLECNHYRKCVHGRQCTPDCPEYSPFRCSRRDRSPGACNGCSSWSRCRFNKFPLLPGRCAPGLPFDFGGRPPRREPHRSGSHLHGLAHRSPSQTGPLPLPDSCHPSGTQHF